MIQIAAQPGSAVPLAVAEAQEAALARESTQPSSTVPAERPPKLQPVADAMAKALRAEKPNAEGFHHGKTRDGVDTTIGAASLDRTLRIIDAFVRALEERGHGIAEHNEGVRILVNGVPIAWRVYEIRDRTPHQPTKKELQAQAQREEDRARWPELYSSGQATEVYRSWDYSPSGRLAMTFTDGTRYWWVGRATSATGMSGNISDSKTTSIRGWRPL